MDVELAFIEDLAAGTFIVECMSRDELKAARSIIEGYRDLRLGLADASLIVLAARYSTTRIVTFDERAFRAVTPLQGGAFTVLPADLGRDERARDEALGELERGYDLGSEGRLARRDELYDR